MSKRIKLVLMVGLLVLIAGLNMVTQSVSSVPGSDYPGLIEYREEGSEALVTVLGFQYTLAPGLVQALDQVNAWRDRLELFLEQVEEIVEKYGRQAQEMMRNLSVEKQNLPL